MNAKPARRGFVYTAACGVAMGASDLVPGVSGGTMALVLGVYDRLIASLGAFTRATVWRAVRAGRWGDAWRAVDGGFLATLALGIAVAIVTLAPLLGALLASYRAAVYAFFFGLIAASAVSVLMRIRGDRVRPLLGAAVAAPATFVLVGLPTAVTPDAPWVLAASGLLAVSALLLPGVSGAFVLVLLGKYELVLDALSRADLAVLAPLAAGMAVGLLAFSRVLALLLRRHHDVTMGVLIGVLLGALRKVWPWQVDTDGRTVAATPPGVAELLGALLLAGAAGALVWGLQRASREHAGPPEGDRAREA